MTDQIKRTLLSWTGEGEQTYFIRIDATVGETHDYVNTVTDHPVEIGSPVTDHVRPEPIRLTLSGVISNAPQFLPSDNVDGSTLVNRVLEVHTPGIRRITPLPSLGIGGQIVQRSFGVGRGAPQGPSGAVLTRFEADYKNAAKVLTFSAEFNRARNVFEELVSLWATGTFIRVETELADYADMVIESLSVPRDPSSGDALQFELALKQTQTVQSEKVAAPKIDVARKSKGKTATTKEATETDKASTGGILTSIKDAFGL